MFIRVSDLTLETQKLSLGKTNAAIPTCWGGLHSSLSPANPFYGVDGWERKVGAARWSSDRKVFLMHRSTVLSTSVNQSELPLVLSLSFIYIHISNLVCCVKTLGSYLWSIREVFIGCIFTVGSFIGELGKLYSQVLSFNGVLFHASGESTYHSIPFIFRNNKLLGTIYF